MAADKQRYNQRHPEATKAHKRVAEPQAELKDEQEWRQERYDTSLAELALEMTVNDLRDHFAAAALSGAMANSRLDEKLTIEMIVADCWKAADAMMAQRGRK